MSGFDDVEVGKAVFFPGDKVKFQVSKNSEVRQGIVYWGDDGSGIVVLREGVAGDGPQWRVPVGQVWI